MRNYNLIQFCEERRGLDKLRKYAVLVTDLLNEYQKGKRYNSNGLLYICFNGEYIPVETVEQFCQKFDKVYDKYLRRGYDIERIECSSGIYDLGYFDADEWSCSYSSNDFINGVCNMPNEIISLADSTQIIEVYARGLIGRDLPTDSTYYFSPEDLGYFIKINKLNFDIENTYIRHYGNPRRSRSVGLIDGLDANRMKENLRDVPYKWKDKNRYNKGYCILPHRRCDGRDSFEPYLCGSGHSARGCDNEVEACCECCAIEQKVAGVDNNFLFNPAYHHVNQRHLLESYIRGEITELGVLRDTLTDVAYNPFLILRYNLVDLCRKFCIRIEPFMVDRHGMITNQYGVSYSALAELYCSGKLTREEIYLQGAIGDINDLSCNK